MPRLGVLSNFFVNLGGVNPGAYAAPTWSVLNLISDCNVDGTWDEGDASARSSRVTTVEPTMMGVEITGKVRVADALTNAAYVRMYDAYFKDLPLDILVLNGLLTEFGASGFRFIAKIFTWSEDQSLGVVLYKDFSIKPCIPIQMTASGAQHVAPPKVANVIAGGTINYSDIGLSI